MTVRIAERTISYDSEDLTAGIASESDTVSISIRKLFLPPRSFFRRPSDRGWS